MSFLGKQLKHAWAFLNAKDTREVDSEVHTMPIDTKANNEALERLMAIRHDGPEREQAINNIVNMEHDMIKLQMPMEVKPNVKAYLITYHAYYHSPSSKVAIPIICKDEKEMLMILEETTGCKAPRLEIKNQLEIPLAMVKIKDLDAQSFYNLMKA
jgi:hypothetical protein